MCGVHRFLKLDCWIMVIDSLAHGLDSPQTTAVEFPGAHPAVLLMVHLVVLWVRPCLRDSMQSRPLPTGKDMGWEIFLHVQQNKKLKYILLASYSSKSLRLNGHFEHFCMVLHVTRRLLLQLFASVLSSHSYSILLQCFDAYAGN